MDEFTGKHITVMGLGRSGQAVAQVLRDLGAIVFCSDNGQNPELEHVAEGLRAKGMDCETGGHTSRALEQTDLIVLSPGIPSTIPILQEAQRRNVPIVSEVEIAWQLTPAKIIAITGTNGKSTTTSLLGKMLNNDGQKAAVAGNIGIAVSGIAATLSKDDYLVIELSSFQLETIDRFRPDVAVLLNITPDHLDRYSTVDEYVAAKKRIFLNQTGSDIAVLNIDDERIRQFEPEIKSSIRHFGAAFKPENGPYADSNGIFLINNGSEQLICRHDELTLPGRHNLENILATLTAAHAIGTSIEAMRQTLTTFEGLPHRLELVREKDGVRFYNDSKATTVESTIAAVQSFDNVLLIAGGKDKGSDFAPLAQPIKKHVAHLTLIGQAKNRMAAELNGSTSTDFAGSLAAAVHEQAQRAKAGDVILLSPACSSYDMFKDFEDRGDQFRKIVQQL